MTKQQISLAILAEIANGATTKEAINTVLGAGSFESIASDLYDELNK